MSWQELQPHKAQAGAPKAPVRVGVHQRGEAPSRAYVVFKADVLKLIGAGTDTYRLAIGTNGENRHQLRIAFDKSGVFVPTELAKVRGGGWWRFTLPPLDRFPECKVPLQAVDYSHDKAGKALIVDLPAWGWNEKIKLDVEQAADVR